MTTIKGELLRRLIKVDAMTLSRWHKAGHLVRYERGRYLVNDVNEFLARCSNNFAEPPTWEALRSGRVTLLGLDEIEAQFRMPRTRLFSLKRSATIRHLKFPGIQGGVRYLADDIKRLAQSEAPFVSADFAAQLLGLDSTQVVRKLAAQGKLEKVRNPNATTTALHISKKSLANVLSERLPEWIDAKDWIEDFNDSGQRLLDVNEAAIALGISPRSVNARLLQEKGRFIASPDGRNKKISPYWVSASFDEEAIFAAEHVATIFTLSPSGAREWRQKGLLVCDIASHQHQGNDTFLRRPCWLAKLTAANPAVPYKRMSEFLRCQLGKNPHILRSAAELSGELSMNVDRINAIATSGQVFAVLTPAKRWHFPETSVITLRQLLGNS